MHQAWLVASDQLGISVQAPFEYPSGTGHMCVAFVHQFGGPSGTIVSSPQDPEQPDICRQAVADGYFVSSINLESYGAFDWELFVSTLDDWGWFGDSRGAPPWYTGTQWS